MAFKLPKILQRAFGIDDLPEQVFVTGYSQLDVVTDIAKLEWADTPPPLYGTGMMVEAYLESIVEGYYGEQNFIQLFYCLPEIFAPVHEIASRVAEANWQLRKIRKSGGVHDDEVIYSDAAFNRLFTQPNPLMSFKDFIYQAVCYELLTGKEYMYVNRPSSLSGDKSHRSVVNWWNLPAHEVCVDLKPNIDIYSSTTINDFVQRYRLPENGRMREFDPDKILPLVKLSLQYGNNLKRTRSPLCGAKAAIKNLIPVYSARGTIYIKQGALGIFVSAKTDESGVIPLTPIEKQNFINDLHGTTGVTGGRIPHSVTNQAVRYEKTGDSIKDLQPFEETLSDAVAIYAALRVPRHLVPSKDHSTFANANADLKSFYSDTIIPMANRYAESFTNFFQLESERKYVYADFSHVDILQENKKERAEVDKTNAATYIQQWQTGTKTLNDILSAQGADESTNPIYNKYIFDMSAVELEIVKNALNLKVVQKEESNSNQNERNNG